MKTITIYQAVGESYTDVYTTRADTIFLINDNTVRISHAGEEATIRLGSNQMAIIRDYYETP